ncbi:MAG: hypothetical protein P8X89_10920 [Reinekea sp.]
MLPKNWGEPMGAPAIFEQQIEIKLLHSASTEGVTDSGKRYYKTIIRRLQGILNQRVQARELQCVWQFPTRTGIHCRAFYTTPVKPCTGRLAAIQIDTSRTESASHTNDHPIALLILSVQAHSA